MFRVQKEIERWATKFFSPSFLLYLALCTVLAVAMIAYEWTRPLLWTLMIVGYRIMVQYFLCRYQNEDVSLGKKGASTHALLYTSIGGITLFPAIEFLLVRKPLSAFIVLSGVACIVAAVVLRFKAMTTLERNYSVFVEVRTTQKLIDNGIYRYIRHPAYLALILLGIGSAFIMHAYGSVLFDVLVFLPIIHWRMNIEERELSMRLKGYREYMEDTKRLIPFVY